MKTPAKALRNVLWFPLATAVVIYGDEAFVNQKANGLILLKVHAYQTLYYHAVGEYGLILDAKQKILFNHDWQLFLNSKSHSHIADLLIKVSDIFCQ